MEIDSSSLNSKLKEFFGFDSFKGDQERIIRNLLAGKDTFVLMPTGGGKSLCFQLPALVMPGTAIVISPLIALMKNQVDVIRGFVEEQNGVAHFLNSSLNRAQIQEVRADVLSGVTKLLYVAPESLTKEENVDLLREVKISFYAVDEAHCISEWGHDFRPEYRRIRDMVQMIGRAPIMALTATATPKVQNDIQKNLGIMDATVFKSSFNRPNLYYEVRDKVDPDKDIIRYIKQHPGKSGIIYCLSRKKVEEIAKLLEINGIRALPYHAGLDAKTRAENQDRFLMEDVEVIVATIAFGMGIDKPDVSFVLHYNMPKNPESYYQEAGRAGRDGMPAECVLLYSGRDVHTNRYMIEHGEPNPELTPAQAHTVREQELDRLRKMTFYCTTTDCLRAFLLRYFGEETGKGGEYGDNCGNCSNCLRARRLAGEQAAMPEQPDGTDVTDAARHMLGLIAATGQRYGMLTVIDALRGSKSEKIRRFRLDRQADYGALSALSAQQVRAIFEEMTVRGYVRIGGGEYPAAMPGPRAQALTEGGERLWVRLPREKEKAAGRKKSAGAAKTGTADAAAPQESELMRRLRRLRMEIATREGVPAYVIFPNSTLYVMCISLPTRRESFLLLPGVGQVKCDKYGRMFCDLIREYLDEQKRNGGTGNG